MKKNNNVIQFPTKEREQVILDEAMYDAINHADNAVEMAHYLINVLQVATDDLKDEFGVEIDLSNLEDPSYNDFRVILNLLVATFYKRYGLSHLFTEDLEQLDRKLNEMFIMRDDLEITFEPEE